jgi:hypothetical protein
MAGTLGHTRLKPDTTVAHPSLVLFFESARNTEHSDSERGGGTNNEGRALGGALATLHAQGCFGVPWGIWRSSIIQGSLDNRSQ